ncbi:MAG: ATP-grasp domain-containing protein [Epsilonproteobacteria bacterium]|nr:ATP-grasp domain-containing protein [Campylobacterota bacterium]
MSDYRVGIWMYQNGGGDVIEKKIVNKLKERGIEAITDLNLRYATAEEGHIMCNGVAMEELDLFFSYNAGGQTQYQVYLYEALDQYIPIINNFKAFSITEDKFKTIHLLKRNGIPTTEYFLCHRDDTKHLRSIFKKWNSKMIYKPVDGWGGIGLALIENESSLDMLLPFLNQMDLRCFYVEKFVNYDKSDYRVDIVDGEFIACYGRKAPENDWKTNITSGGKVILREPNDEIVELAKKAAKITGLEIAGVDIIYDLDKERYIVLEVNGIPAFATPEQEKMGLNFNDKKIDAIVNLIEKKIKGKK